MNFSGYSFKVICFVRNSVWRQTCMFLTSALRGDEYSGIPTMTAVFKEIKVFILCLFRHTGTWLLCRVDELEVRSMFKGTASGVFLLGSAT